jgi:hypothetical protein
MADMGCVGMVSDPMACLSVVESGLTHFLPGIQLREEERIMEYIKVG